MLNDMSLVDGAALKVLFVLQSLIIGCHYLVWCCWRRYGSDLWLENIGCGFDVNFDIGLGRMLCDTCPVSGWMGHVCSLSSDNVVCLELLRERECERICERIGNIPWVRWRVLFQAAVPPFLKMLWHDNRFCLIWSPQTDVWWLYMYM